MSIYELISKVSLFIPIATFLFRIISTIISIKKCSPQYTMLYKQHITKKTSSIEGLSIDYKGTKVEELTISTFAFWNSGKIGLKKESYGITRPYIGCNGTTEILGYEIRSEYLHQHINLKVDLSDNKLSWSFDEIVHNQGFVIDIIHTGKSNADLVFSANFKNAKVKRKFIYHKLHKSILDKIPYSLLWLLALICIICASLSNMFIENFSMNSIGLAIISIFLVLMGSILHFRENYVPYWGVPLKLQASIKESDI